ncbi:hypothetical protein IJ00_12470 [Calothrix sp. 336/3]|nr:hypothetical protein IJ00_12470 [Calothrix sp. 336/3]
MEEWRIENLPENYRQKQLFPRFLLGQSKLWEFFVDAIGSIWNSAKCQFNDYPLLFLYFLYPIPP